MRKNIVVLSSLLALTSLVGCQKAPSTIRIIGSEIVLTDGVFKYDVEVSPTKANKDVFWSVSDSSIATISDKGVISDIKKDGEFTVTATSKLNKNVKGELKVNAYSATPIVDTTFYTAYEAAHGNFITKFTEAVKEKEEKIVECTLNDGDFAYCNYVKNAYYKKYNEKYNLYFPENKYDLEIHDKESLASLVNEAKTKYSASVTFYQRGTDLYYCIYLENEDQTKFHYNLTGYNKDGFLIREVKYSDFLYEDKELKLESPYIDYVHPAAIL